MCGQVCANLAVHVGRNHADQDFSCSQVTLLFLLAGNMLASTSAVSAKTLQFILAGIMPTRTLARFRKDNLAVHIGRNHAAQDFSCFRQDNLAVHIGRNHAD